MKIADNPYYIGISSEIGGKLDNTAKALAKFICVAGETSDLRILLPNGNTILNTNGIFIDRCADKEFLEELKKTLIPMQKKVESELGFPECHC
jgi:hypothetical protein